MRKQAYVSAIVQIDHQIDSRLIADLDNELSRNFTGHEIICVARQNWAGNELDSLSEQELVGPLTLLFPWDGAKRAAGQWQALSRCSGDYVILFHEIPVEGFSDVLTQIGSALLDEVDIVQVSPQSLTPHDWILYRIVNALGGKNLSKTVITVMSRRATNALLEHGAGTSRLMRSMIRDSSLPKTTINIDDRVTNSRKSSERILDAVEIISTSTRLNIWLPISLAGAFVLAAGLMTVFVITRWLISAQAPEGWTSIIIALCVGFSLNLYLMSLIWRKIELGSGDQASQHTLPIRLTIIPPHNANHGKQ